MKSITLRTISDEHRNLWQLGHVIGDLADEIEQGAKLDQPFFDAVFTYIDEYVNRMHHPREEALLFDLLRQRDPGLIPLIEELEREHTEGAPLIKRLRQSLAGSQNGPATQEFVDCLRELVAEIRGHIGKEEGRLLPRAHKVLTVDDIQQLDAVMLGDSDPRFGPKAQAEFRELFHRVVNLAPESVGLGGSAAGQLQKGAAPRGQQALLTIRQLESSYGRIQALKGVNLEVRQGELVALVGANGAGKTTLLKVISGVQSAAVGNVVFDGDDITRLPAHQRVQRGICQVPEGRQVFGPLSVEDNLRLGAYSRATKKNDGDLESVYETFPVLKEKRLLPAGTLSGGQQQMLAIGRAVMARPRMLLLDEPSMGLAPLLVEEVFNVVRTLKRLGMTILLVEQNAYAALEIADRAYVMETGTITLSGRGAELLDNDQVRAAYLGM